MRRSWPGTFLPARAASCVGPTPNPFVLPAVPALSLPPSGYTRGCGQEKARPCSSKLSTGGPVSGQPSRGRKAVSAFVAVQGGSLALTGHVERATTGTQGRDTGRDQTGQSTTGHGQRLVVVLRGRLLVALLGLVRLLGLLGLLRLLGNLGLFRLLGLGLVDPGPGRGSIGAHTDRAVLGGDQGLGRLVGLALEQAAGPSSGATGQAEARLTGLGVLGDREADGVAVTDRVDGLTGIDVDQLDTLGGVQVDLDVGGVGLDEELADDLTGVAGGLFRSDPQGGLGLLL